MTTILGEDDAKFCDITYDNGNVGVYRINGIPAIEIIYKALGECGINPYFVVIDNMWGHLTMWFCNWDGSDIEI